MATHTHAHTHTHLYSGPTCVRLAYTTRTTRRTHLSDSCAHKVIFSPLHADIQTRVMENILSLIKTQLGVTQSSAVISKKSPLPKCFSSEKAFRKTHSSLEKLSHTHSRRRQRLHSSCLSPLTLHLILHSSPSLCFSLSCFPLLSLSRSLPPPPPTSPSTSPPLCVW